VNKGTFEPTVAITSWAYGSPPNTPTVSGIPAGNSGNTACRYSPTCDGTTTYADFVVSPPTAIGTYWLTP
jgi:hypothetical protein